MRLRRGQAGSDVLTHCSCSFPPDPRCQSRRKGPSDSRHQSLGPFRATGWGLLPTCKAWEHSEPGRILEAPAITRLVRRHDLSRLSAVTVVIVLLSGVAVVTAPARVIEPARHESAVWTASIDLDASPLAADLRAVLDIAAERVPARFLENRHVRNAQLSACAEDQRRRRNVPSRWTIRVSPWS
jgi:hypothetical protein